MTPSKTKEQVDCPKREDKICPQETRIAIAEKEIEDLNHQLYGNGQPGQLEKMDKKIEETNKELNTMKNKFYLLIGILSASGSAVGSIIGQFFF